MAKQAVATTGEKGIGAWIRRLVSRVRGFSSEVNQELHKVAWPTKEELKASTMIVLLILVILAVIVGAYDLVFKNVIIQILKLA